MELHQAAPPELQSKTSRSWAVAFTSFLFVLLQSVCAAVMAISGLRLVIGLTSLAAASLLPSFFFILHEPRFRIPMLAVAVLGSAVNLFVLWRIRTLRARPASQWRIQPPTTAQKRSETAQFAISLVTLGLVIVESVLHHRLHGSF